MNKFVKLVAASFLALGLLSSAAMADADKGQKYYLKIFKDKTGFNGTKFAAMHTQAEWEELFANDGAGFIKEFSEAYPALKAYLEGDQFKEKVMEHIKDFAIKYASDSGNVPSC